MGMDLVGRHPRQKSNRSNDRGPATGEYFRATIWSWAAILDLCNRMIDLYALPFDTAGWDFNDGKGLRTQKQCDKLADALEAYLTDNPPADGIISVDLGMYVDEKGHFTETGTRSAHSTNLDHVRQFIGFLRSCGGFRIW